MRLLIVVTVPAYKLVDPESGAWRSHKMSDTDAMRCAIGDDQVVAIFQAAGESEKDIRDKTTKWVTEVAITETYAQARVYVAGHMGFVSVDQIREKVGSRLAACASFSHYPKASGLDPLSDVLYRLVREFTPEAYQLALDNIQANENASRTQRFATISHQVIGLFLPIAFDLNTWRAIDCDQKLLGSIINTYINGQCRLTQARAHFYNGLESHPDTLEKIIEESDLLGDEDWALAKSLLPRRAPKVESGRDQAELYCVVFHDHDVLGSLRDRDGMLKLKLELEQDDVFSRWSSELETALTSLKSKVEGRPPPLSNEQVPSGGAGQMDQHSAGG
ncbi:MAG: hypothetical protein ACXW18_05630 [Pyrinomonadaceae bacterium]